MGRPAIDYFTCGVFRTPIFDDAVAREVVVSMAFGYIVMFGIPNKMYTVFLCTSKSFLSLYLFKRT